MYKLDTASTDFTSSTWRSNSSSACSCDSSDETSVKPDYVVEFVDRYYQAPEVRQQLVRAQAVVRGWLARRRFARLRLMDEMDADLEICLERHQRKSAIRIQRAFRAYLRRHSKVPTRMVRPHDLPAHHRLGKRGGYSASSATSSAASGATLEAKLNSPPRRKGHHRSPPPELRRGFTPPPMTLADQMFDDFLRNRPPPRPGPGPSPDKSPEKPLNGPGLRAGLSPPSNPLTSLSPTFKKVSP
eukprot:EG_transcript_17250